MTDMVERVARALCDDTLKRWRSPLGVKAAPWREFIPAARAAIEAMREPDDAMFTVGWHQRHPWREHAPPPSERPGLYAQIKVTVRAEWQAMIDAALTPSSAPSPQLGPSENTVNSEVQQ